MKNYLSGTFSQIQIHKIQQNLSNAKKKILIQWIPHLTIIKFPTYSKLVLEIAKKIYQKYIFFAFQVSLKLLRLHSINHN